MIPGQKQGTGPRAKQTHPLCTVTAISQSRRVIISFIEIKGGKLRAMKSED